VPGISMQMHSSTMFGLSMVVVAGCALVLSFSSVFIVILICLLFDGFARAVVNTIRSLYGQQLVDPRWRTYISSVNASAMALGFAAASLAGGFLIELHGFPFLFRAAALTGLLSGAVAILYPRLAAVSVRRAAKT
jgi:predicted MFS family arabinose efflux permease